jgi:hypothetical protein
MLVYTLAFSRLAAAQGNTREQVANNIQQAALCIWTWKGGKIGAGQLCQSSSVHSGRRSLSAAHCSHRAQRRRPPAAYVIPQKA